MSRREITAGEMIDLLKELPADRVLTHAQYPTEAGAKIVRKVTGVSEYGEVTLSDETHAYFYDPADTD